MLNLRRAAAASTLLLLAPLAACGGGDDTSSAPDDASKDEFCEAYNSLYDSLVAADPGTGEEEAQAAAVDALQEWTAEMRDVGTPEDMPEEAREGFELILTTAEEIDEDSTMEDLQALGGDLTDAEKEQAEAFTSWTQEECPLDVPSEAPTDLPTDVPSESESEVPSETESE